MTEETGSVWIGFDLGGTKMLAAAYGSDWEELGRRRRKTKGRDGSESGVQRIISTIERLLEDSAIKKHQIAGIGIGCPGPIDLEEGKILTTPNLGWDDVEIRAVLEKHFSCSAVVLNDVDAGVYAEYCFGSAKDSRCAVGVFPGTGVGGGCVYEGRILHGAGVSCMEIGHTRIASTNRSSGCNLSGTVESEASRLAIAAESCKAAYRGDAPYLSSNFGTDISGIRSGAIADAINNGDDAVKDLVRQACQSIGYAVVNVVHLLAPDTIILGGGLVEAMEAFIVDTVNDTAKANVMDAYRDRFRVVAAQLGDEAGVMGAAAWARQELG